MPEGQRVIRVFRVNQKALHPTANWSPIASVVCYNVWIALRVTKRVQPSRVGTTQDSRPGN
jgi:hypothetical protein